MIREYLQHIKDEILEAIIEKVVREKIRPFGDLIDCQVDTHVNSISAEVLLHGDTYPIKVAVARYEVFEAEGHHWLELRRFSSTKEWIQSVMDTFLVGKRFQLPTGVAPIV